MSSTWTAVAGSLTEQRLHADVGQQPECEQRILAAFLAGYQRILFKSLWMILLADRLELLHDNGIPIRRA